MVIVTRMVLGERRLWADYESEEYRSEVCELNDWRYYYTCYY